MKWLLQIDRVIEDMDDAIGYLIQGLEARHLDECIQTIIVSLLSLGAG